MVYGVWRTHTQTLTHRIVYLLCIVFIDCVCEHLRVQFYIECLWAAKLLPVLSVRCIIKLFLLALNVYSGQKKKVRLVRNLCESSILYAGKIQSLKTNTKNTKHTHTRIPKETLKRFIWSEQKKTTTTPTTKHLCCGLHTLLLCCVNFWLSFQKKKWIHPEAFKWIAIFSLFFYFYCSEETFF